jgi:transcriptional regulator with XRE-family HTH domain
MEAPLNRLIGQRLRTLREERRIPRERLALALEMTSENLRNYESGKQKLTLAMLPTIAAIYDISLENLLLELFELRTEPAGHPESAAIRQNASQSENRNSTWYGETKRSGFDMYLWTPRVLAIA